MAKKLKIQVEMIPTSGKTVKKTIKVSATGASVGDILKTAGFDPKNKDFTVNGKSANLDTHVTEQDVVKAKTSVRVSERPQGS